MYIFTKTFFRLNPIDQAAVIAAAIDELQGCIGRHAKPADDRRAEQKIERLKKKAIEFGIYEKTQTGLRAKTNEEKNMSNEVNLVEEENRIAKEAIAYLAANELVVNIQCPKDNPLSEDVAGFLSDYFADAEADLTVEMKERIESLYPDEEN